MQLYSEPRRNAMENIDSLSHLSTHLSSDESTPPVAPCRLAFSLFTHRAAIPGILRCSVLSVLQYGGASGSMWDVGQRIISSVEHPPTCQPFSDGPPVHFHCPLSPLRRILVVLEAPNSTLILILYSISRTAYTAIEHMDAKSPTSSQRQPNCS